jgi:hypothetical protein
MRKDDIVRLRHMLDAAREAQGFAASRSRSDLDRDRQLLLALVKDVEIIGEAASRVSVETGLGARCSLAGHRGDAPPPHHGTSRSPRHRLSAVTDDLPPSRRKTPKGHRLNTAVGGRRCIRRRRRALAASRVVDLPSGIDSTAHKGVT